MNAFAGDSNIAAEIWRLHLKHSFSLIIETGTEFGHTALWLAKIADVITIENNYDHYLKAVDRCDEHRVRCVFGDSASVLRSFVFIRGGYGEEDKILFYLDAHCNETQECSISEELKAISQITCKPIIVIHDCLNPNNPELGYDTYNGKPLSLEMINADDVLDVIYMEGGWDHYYNSVAEGGLRGVIYITPKL